MSSGAVVPQGCMYGGLTMRIPAIHFVPVAVLLSGTSPGADRVWLREHDIFRQVH